MFDVICEYPLSYTLEYDAYFSENLRRATTRHIENGVKYYKKFAKSVIASQIIRKTSLITLTLFFPFLQILRKNPNYLCSRVQNSIETLFWAGNQGKQIFFLKKKNQNGWLKKVHFSKSPILNIFCENLLDLSLG